MNIKVEGSVIESPWLSWDQVSLIPGLYECTHYKSDKKGEDVLVVICGGRTVWFYKTSADPYYCEMTSSMKETYRFRLSKDAMTIRN